MNTRITSTDKPPPRDYRQEVTNDIIKLLEEGAAPWQKPWTSDSPARMPMNPTTGKPYRGGNVLSLMIAGMRRGYTDPRWMTYKQAAEHDWQVRKGEKGTQIEFWDVGRSNEEDGESDADRPRSRMIHRVYTVFNAQQIDGIPPMPVTPRKPFEVIEAGESILKDSGADIRHGGDRAYYSRKTDHVQLPDKQDFVDAPAYYGTACHELAHWSGHPSRLNRPTLTESYKFGDQQYAKEELVADLASCFMAAEKGIPFDPAQTAAYVGSWIKALKDDKNEIFRAASAASKAADYVLGIDRTIQTPTTEETHAESVTASRSKRARAL
jgi:antirestriction protein ArdC